MPATPRVDGEALLEFGAAVYAGAGMPEADARLVADTLVQADLWGHQSHGVLRLGWYLDRIRNGVMDPVTKPEFAVDAGTVAVIDGHDGVGHVVTALATREAVKRAKAHGLGAVGVRMSNHFGTCMYYTRIGALEGCAMFLTSNCGHFMIAINIEAFQPLAAFNARMEEYIAELKSVPLAKGFAEVFYPGEIEANNDIANRRDGLQLPEDTLADLARIARETGLLDKLPFAAT